jgi:superfamily II DNA/RNA helicase
MNDHLGKANFDSSTVHTLVIDEFDKCLEFGFQEEMAQVIGQLPRLKRRFLLSATDTEEIPRFTGLNRTQKLDFLNGEEEVSSRIHIYKVMSPVKDKLETLYRLLCTLGSKSTLVFCNHRESVERVGKYLQSQKYPCGVFHGGMEQDDRERSLYKFRNGSCNVLVSTDLAARGLDIPEVHHIIHYHMPAGEDAYIHRTGRTARWDAQGNAYLILHSEEHVPEYVADEVEDFELPERPGRPQPPQWTTLYVGRGKKDKINKVDIAGYFYKKGGLSREDVGNIDVHDYYAYVTVRRAKVKQLLALVGNEKIKGVKTRIDIAK